MSIALNISAISLSMMTSISVSRVTSTYCSGQLIAPKSPSTKVLNFEYSCPRFEVTPRIWDRLIIWELISMIMIVIFRPCGGFWLWPFHWSLESGKSLLLIGRQEITTELSSSVTHISHSTIPTTESPHLYHDFYSTNPDASGSHEY